MIKNTDCLASTRPASWPMRLIVGIWATFVGPDWSEIGHCKKYCKK